jgi:hypothetical protein
MTEHAEIRGKLTMDDAASGAIEHIAHGLGLVEHKARHVAGEMGGLLKQSVATAVGFQFDRGIHSLVELGHEVVNAAKELGSEEKAIAGVLSMTDKVGLSYKEIKAQASELHEDLEGMAISMGATTESVLGVFGDIAARSQKTAEEVKNMVGQMIQAGKLTPGGMEGLASGMSMIEMGIARARNPVVQLIAQSNVLADQLHKGHMNAKEVAKAMGKLAPESQVRLAEDAIARMAEKAKEVPMGFGELTKSMSAMREQIFEAVGVPILREAINPALKELRGYMLDHRKEVEELAHSMGTKVASWVKAAASALKDGFHFIESHADEIKEAIVTGADALRAAVQFVVDHKEVIAGLMAARMVQTSVVPKVMGLVEAAAPLAKGAAGAGGALWGAIKEGAPELGIKAATSNAEAFVPLVATVAAFGAAVVAWKLAIDQWHALMNETGGGKREGQLDMAARKDAMQDLNKKLVWNDVDLEFFEELRAKMVAGAAAAGENARAVGEQADAIWKSHSATRESVKALDEAFQQAGSAGAFRMAGEYAGTGESAETNVYAEQWIELFNQAAKAHNTALMDYAASTIAGSEALQNGLLVSGKKLEGGFDGLADLVQNKSEDFAKILRTMKPDEALKGGSTKPLQLNFNGNTFHLRQDFRDANPDRIMLLFKRDIAHAAMFRTASRLTSPFGM